jgi:hypothetical protein
VSARDVDGDAVRATNSDLMAWRRLTGTIASVGIVVTLFAVGVAAAAPKPWEWTPAAASRAVVAAHLAVFPSLVGDTGEITAATCLGQGTANAKRFTAFRCASRVFFNSKPVRQAIVWVRIRRVGKGQVCANIGSLAAIPVNCLNTTGPSRTEGTTLHAWYAVRQAMTVRMGTPTLWRAAISCLSYGAGFYTCSFESATEEGRASVTLTTDGPIVRISALQCLVMTERQGCAP